jgi:RNA-directed DNA polymerase
MSLETPDKISNLQRKLYGKAKADPAYRFYLLYDKIHRPDILGCEFRRNPATDSDLKPATVPI